MSFVVDGRQERKSTGTQNKRLAERIYVKTMADIEEGRFFDRPVSISMVEVLERFMTEVSPLRPASHERNLHIVKHFKLFFGDTLLDEVQAPLLSRYKSERLRTVTKRGRTVLPDTVKKELSLLRQIFNIAIDEWEMCKENPVRKIMKSLPQEERRVRYVLPEEAERLRFTIPGWLKPIVITACQTGLRRKNLLSLTTQQVDFASKRLIVDKTKNGDPVGIVMTSIVHDTLLALMRDRKVVSPYVFCDDHGRPYTPHKVSMAFTRACRRAGVDNLRLHDLRHDFATLMLRKTKNLVDVQHAMGHKDSRMTMRYAHLLPDDLKEAFNAIDNTGTALILSQNYHSMEKEKGCISATP